MHSIFLLGNLRHANIRWRSGKPPNSKAHCAPCPYPPEIQWRWAGCCLSRPLADDIPAGGPRTLKHVFLFFARHITFGILHVITHLAKCCQESFNYLNSKINCCGCRAKSSTVLLLAFQILWKISLWTGILPQADRAQHGFTELTVYWDIVSNKI